MYDKYCSEKSDINEHLPKLLYIASDCDSVTEFGVRTGLSSIALLLWCDNVISYDLETNDKVKEIQENVPHWKFIIGDTRKVQIEETDMLFIDTLHNGDQLYEELCNAADKVNKYIVFHDTTTFSDKWETNDIWLSYGLNKFLDEHKEWRQLKKYTNNNGLTVWKRVKEPVVTVFTAIFGNYDYLKLQPEQTVDVKYVCFTNTDNLEIEKWAEKQWEVIKVDNIEWVHNRIQAKFYRTHPYNYFKWTTMWIDGTARLKSERAIEDILNMFESDKDIMLFRHPERKTILEEAMFCKNFKDRYIKYEWLPLIEQVRSYLDNGYDESLWLFATWMLVMREWYELIDALSERYEENIYWTYQDQISFPYIMWKNNIKVQSIEWINLWSNDYISFTEWHLSDA